MGSALLGRASSWLRTQLKRTPLRPYLARTRDRWLTHREEAAVISAWEASARPVPPPHLVKQRAVRAYARRHRLRVLIETGTFKGEMVEAMRHHFARIVSVELGDEMHRRAVARFAACPNVEIVHGDSGQVLPVVLDGLHEPALFWLDGHFSAGQTARGELETPILGELDHILRHPVAGHVVLVDDARHFDGTHDYPTLVALEEIVRRARPGAEIEVADDIVRVVLDPGRPRRNPLRGPRACS